MIHLQCYVVGELCDRNESAAIRRYSKRVARFIAAYDGFVGESTLTDNQKTLILIDVRVTKVRKRIFHLLHSPDTYVAFLEELKRRLGDVSLVKIPCAGTAVLNNL